MKFFKNNLLLIACLSITFLAACQNNKTNSNAPGDELGIHLENNEPWKANPETTAGILAMQKLINNFSDKEQLSKYHNLKKQLEDEFVVIVKKCTMEGEAHEQLHNYFIPMKDYFNKLGSPVLNTAKEGFENLEKHLNLYTAYFK